MIDINHLCPGCMSHWEDTQGVCPRCGFSWQNKTADKRPIPTFSIIGGRYLLGCSIGAGGFGIIYMAMDLVEEHPVAVKEFFPAGMAKREAEQVSPASAEWERGFRDALCGFRKEADMLSRFREVDGVVSFRDFVEENGTCYLVMDNIPGNSLARYMKEKQSVFSQKEALRLMRPILTAAGKMHEQGVIHRDISPENLILGPDGSLTLIDFGAAREYSLAGEENLTIILKKGYAPEEQYYADGRQGPWTDIYACCAVLYQMVSGIVPQEAASRGQKDELLPLDQIPGIFVEPSFARAIEKGISPDAEKRWESLDSLMAVLYPASEAPALEDTAAEYIYAEAEGAADDGYEESKTGSERESISTENDMAAGQSRKAFHFAPLLAAAGAVVIILCAVVFLNREGLGIGDPDLSEMETYTVDLHQMETCTVELGDTVFEVEVPAALMEYCTFEITENYAALRFDNGYTSRSIINISETDLSEYSYYYCTDPPILFTDQYLYEVEFDRVIYLEDPEEEQYFSQEELWVVREGVRAMQIHTPDNTYTGAGLLDSRRTADTPETLLSIEGCLYDWSLTLPEEMAGAVQTTYEYKQIDSTLYESVDVGVYYRDEDTSTAEGAFKITIGDISPEHIDSIGGWHETEIAENVYLSLETGYGAPLDSDLQELLTGNSYDILADSWETMLAYLDGVVFTTEDGEEIPLAPLLLGTAEELNPENQNLGVALTLPMDVKNIVQCDSTEEELSFHLDGIRLFTILRTDTPEENAVDLGNGVWLQPDYLRFVPSGSRVFPEGKELPDTWEESWEHFYDAAERIFITGPEQEQLSLYKLLDSAQFQKSSYSEYPQLYTDPEYVWSLEFPPELFGEIGSLSWYEDDTNNLNEVGAIYVYQHESGGGIRSLFSVNVLEPDAADPYNGSGMEIYRDDRLKIIAHISSAPEESEGLTSEEVALLKQIRLIKPDGESFYFWD